MIVDPISSCSLTISKLRSFHLADNDSTGIDELLNCWGGGVALWVEIVVGSVPTATFGASDVVDVFDSKSNLISAIKYCSL